MSLDLKRTPDIEAVVTLLSADEGGRSTPAISGYRPAHSVSDDYLTSGLHQYIGQDRLAPGQSCPTNIWLLSPDLYPHSLWVGKVLKVQEGGRLVGHAKITKVFNVALLRDS